MTKRLPKPIREQIAQTQEFESSIVGVPVLEYETGVVFPSISSDPELDHSIDRIVTNLLGDYFIFSPKSLYLSEVPLTCLNLDETSPIRGVEISTESIRNSDNRSLSCKLYLTKGIDFPENRLEKAVSRFVQENYSTPISRACDSFTAVKHALSYTLKWILHGKESDSAATDGEVRKPFGFDSAFSFAQVENLETEQLDYSKVQTCLSMIELGDYDKYISSIEFSPEQPNDGAIMALEPGEEALSGQTGTKSKIVVYSTAFDEKRTKYLGDFLTKLDGLKERARILYEDRTGNYSEAIQNFRCLWMQLENRLSPGRQEVSMKRDNKLVEDFLQYAEDLGIEDPNQVEPFVYRCMKEMARAHGIGNSINILSIHDSLQDTIGQIHITTIQGAAAGLCEKGLLKGYGDESPRSYSLGETSFSEFCSQLKT